MTVVERPYGSWLTPITSELVVAAAVRLGEVRVDGADPLWSELRPAEGGRTQLVRRRGADDSDGGPVDLLPAGFDARTAVHEYGGAAWWVRDGVTWFTNWADQRLYRLAPGSAPEPLTAEPPVPRGDRFADGEVSPDGTTIVCVRERHPAEGGPAAVRNEIVRLAADLPSEPEVLVTGPDFVAAPRLSPDGRALAYLRWNHPAMPWDATELVRLDLATGESTVLAGGPAESVSEPRWTPDGALWFLSDRTGWWNLYRRSGSAEVGAGVEPMVLLDAEIGVPGWGLGSARYAVLPNGRVVFGSQRDGYDGLAVRQLDGTVTELDLPFSAYTSVLPAGPDAVLAIAGSPTAEPAVVRVELSTEPTVTTLRPPRDLGLAPGYVSVPEHVSFPSPAVDPDAPARTAHALFYPPTNPAYRAPAGELPPLLVVIHGGPTASAQPVLQVGLQYWTSRGFAVVDVNYGGSTGYGRAYREELLGNWGLVDVADCIAAASWLAEHDRADPARLCIRGGSAGGYTTLAALVRADTPFAAGADHFGVSDLEALAAETHKFESRYLDRLVGPYPQARDVYLERSPITHVDRLTRPLIVLQGSEDAVVPPGQSELIVEALRAKGVPVAYLLFDGEQHGFRRAENIRRAMDAELSFYGQVLGFELPAEEGIEPVTIENLATTGS
jgi:dipeptidyl aminopeptidase/acylaminoacyl peptidase